MRGCRTWAGAMAPAFLAACLLIQGVEGKAATPLEGFVDVNGVRLQYFDWGGTGPALILLHGLGANPRVFDDLAPAFTDRFHVIAYARRGSGSSDARGPYDVGTLTEDLRGLMDALDIPKANLLGHSAAGDEITQLAAVHPERVIRLVYFDAAYDWADPDFKAAVKALPVGFFDPPASALASLAAYRAYQQKMLYPALDDMRRVEAQLRQRVVVQANGNLKMRMDKEVVDALYTALFANPPRQYAQVSCPALAIYADHLYDLSIADEQRRQALAAYERDYWKPFQDKSIERVRREFKIAQIMQVSGTHVSFMLTGREQVVKAVRKFLGVANDP